MCIRDSFSGVELGRPRHEIRLNGARGALRLDLAAQLLWHTPLGGTETAIEPTAAQRRGWRVEEDFVAAIREGRHVMRTDFLTGVLYMHFTEAVARSSRHQEPVALPLSEFSNPSL